MDGIENTFTTTALTKPFTAKETKRFPDESARERSALHTKSFFKTSVCLPKKTM